MYCFYKMNTFRFVVMNKNWQVKELCNASTGTSGAKINLDSVPNSWSRVLRDMFLVSLIWLINASPL